MCTHILYVFVSYNNSSNRITLLRQDKEPHYNNRFLRPKK